MICLIDAEEDCYEGFFRRLCRRISGDDGIRCRKASVFGMPVFIVTLPVMSNPRGRACSARKKEAAVRRTTGAAAAWLRSIKAGRLVFAKDFPYRALILREGFEEAEGAVLTELLAGEIADMVCPDGETAALIAGSLTGNAARALWKLCARYRHVLTVTESGGSALYAAIARKLGVSVVSDPTPGQLRRADIAVVFDAPAKNVALSDTCITVPVKKAPVRNIACRFAVAECIFGTKDEGGGKSPPESRIRERFPLDALLACALEAGVLQPEDIRIHSVRMSLLPAAVHYG